MSSSLSRRLANRRAEVTQKLIVFCIQQEWFTLPIQAVQKVVLMGHVHGSPYGDGLRFTQYQNQEILVINAEQQIFGRANAKLALPSATEESVIAASPACLLIVQNQQGELIGIPLNNQPSLRRVPLSAFRPLPTAYLASGNIRCISALIKLPEGEPPLFLLNLDHLLNLEYWLNSELLPNSSLLPRSPDQQLNEASPHLLPERSAPPLPPSDQLP